MNTTFEDVMVHFLSSITDYDFLQMEETDVNREVLVLMKKSLGSFIENNGIAYDDMMEEFNRQLSDLELNIITTGMLYYYLDQKIYNITLLRMSLSSKDYQIYSQANHLNTLLTLKNDTNKQFYYLQGRHSLASFIKGGA